MSMHQNHNIPVSKSRARPRIIPALYALVILLQVLDLHSTLRGIGHLQEANHLISGLAEYVGFAPAIALFKAACVGSVVFSFRVWKRAQGLHDILFTIGLLVMASAYMIVVINNYQH